MVCDDVRNKDYPLVHSLSSDFPASNSTSIPPLFANVNLTAIDIENQTSIQIPSDEEIHQIRDCSFDLPDADIDDPGQQCFGKKSDVERVLDDRCCTKIKRSKCIHLSGTLLVMCVIGVVLVYFLRHYLKDMLEWLQSLNGWLSGLIFVLLFTAVSFPMTWGYIALNLACGYLYGFFMGLLTVTISVAVGVVVSLIVCRKFIKNLVQSKLQSEHLKAIIRVVESRRGFKVVVLTRLTPIPFGLQNGLFAITNMRIHKCLLASVIGLLPTQTLNTYIGSSLRTMEDILKHHSIGDYFLLVIQLGISAFLMWYVIRRARHELNKACLPQSEDEEKGENANRSFYREKISNYFKGHKYTSVPDRDEPEEVVMKREEKKRSTHGHKRAHSASAILYSLENGKLSDEC